MKSQRSEVGKMRWRSTETPSFSGAAGSEPAIVEVFDALDRDGNIVAAITKDVDGTIAFTVDGEEVGSGNISDIAYDATTWNGNTDAPTKNAIRDKIETIISGGISNVSDDTSPTLGGNLDVDTFNIEGADAADFVKLSELTASSAELNYVDGVTSAIQTQLDTKLANVVEDTSPTLGGDLALGGFAFTGAAEFDGAVTFNDNVTFSGSGTNVTVWDTAKLDADHEYHGTVIKGKNAGATIAQFEVVYMGGSDKWLLADANGSGTYPAWGLAVAAYVDTNAAEILTKGLVRDDTWNWTPGGAIYLSTTPGALTQTAPSSTTEKIQLVGRALTADIAEFNFTAEYMTVT
jgi:hypothetical protein